MIYISSFNKPERGGEIYQLANPGHPMASRSKDAFKLYDWLTENAVFMDSATDKRVYLNGVDTSEARGVCPEYAITHTKHSMRIYDFVDSVRCFDILPRGDLCYSTGGDHNRSLVQYEHSILDISCESKETIQVYDKYGSVIRYDSEGTGVVILGLLDFLTLMSKYLRVNLMRYEYIRFHMSTLYNYAETLHIPHGVEVDRLYAKALMLCA